MCDFGASQRIRSKRHWPDIFNERACFEAERARHLCDCIVARKSADGGRPEGGTQKSVYKARAKQRVAAQWVRVGIPREPRERCEVRCWNCGLDCGTFFFERPSEQFP